MRKSTLAIWDRIYKFVLAFCLLVLGTVLYFDTVNYYQASERFEEASSYNEHCILQLYAKKITKEECPSHPELADRYLEMKHAKESFHVAMLCIVVLFIVMYIIKLTLRWMFTGTSKRIKD